ncbi:redox-regulated ATPase YchF [candidate division GN15 bacterium]|nr:redox-regulated ATPase YchF [candidate division GN15 bacterium]
MKLGIIGAPQSGKTTVFNAASGQTESVGDFSQAAHRAIIKVPDERVDKLAEIVQPKKVTYAEIEFLDAPGFKGAGKKATASEINPDLRLMDALVLVIDAFSPDADPKSAIRNLIDEMLIADQVVVENNLEKKQRKVKLTGDKSEARDIELLERCLKHLEAEQPLIELDWTPDERKALRGYAFFSMKPILIVINIVEQDIGKADELALRYAEWIQPGKRDVAVICGAVEMELVELEGEERDMFMQELGITTPAVEKVIQKSYALLGLISFLTAGDKEVRAWPVRAGSTAQQAAGAVHSDIARGFIRAEVTDWTNYLEHPTQAALKAAGKIRVEGKDYIVQDGDEILFRFNV